MKISKKINLFTTGLVVIALTIIITPSLVFAATDPVLAACTKAISKGACTTANINTAKKGATDICKAYNGGDAGPRCIQNYAIDLINTAAKDHPKSAKALSNSLGRAITEGKKNASTDSGGSSSAAADPNKCTKEHCDLVAKYINPAIRLLTAIMGIASVASIIYGGIMYSAAGGDPQKVTKAKGIISKTILALIGFFFLYAILQFITPGGIFR